MKKSNIFLHLTILERKSQVQEGQADHSLSECNSNKDNHYSYSFGMQSISVFGLISAIKNKEAGHREGPELFYRRPHEPDTPKRSNCCGRPNASQQRQQHHCSSVTGSRVLSRSWQRSILCDQTLNQKKRLNTRRQRIYTTSQ